jgi:hypothetical protein
MRNTTLSTSNQDKLPSNRNFGGLFTVIFTCLGIYGYIKAADQNIWIGWIACSAVIGTITLLFPKLLTPFNKTWFLIGELLGKIVSPLVLGIIFFVVLTPVGLITKLFGRDTLRLKRTEASSYWVDRTPPGPSPEAFKNQF